MTYQQYRNEIERLQQRLADVLRLVQRYDHSGVNLETHRLANEIRKMIEREVGE